MTPQSRPDFRGAHLEGSLRGIGRRENRLAGRDPQGLSAPGKKAAPGSQPWQQEGRGAVQGGVGCPRSAGRSGQARPVRPRRDRRHGAERPRQRYYRDFATGAGAGASYATIAASPTSRDADDFPLRIASAGAAARSYACAAANLHYRLGRLPRCGQRRDHPADVPDGSTEVTSRPAPANRAGAAAARQGRGGSGGGPPGDALVEVEVRPHRFFTPQGRRHPRRAAGHAQRGGAGRQVPVPTPAAPSMIACREGSNTGSVLRLKGKGVRRARR